jgi:CheY-like chemotaxis protein
MENLGTILIIDDEKGYRDFYKFILEPLGYKVSSAEDGEEGLRMATENKYDVILLDVHMPKMKGDEVFARIRKIRPEQIIIIFSSSSDPSFSFEDRAKVLGAFECLYKPVDMEDMLKIITRAMSFSGGPK